MTEAAGPGDAIAIGDDTQYQPVAATGDLRIPVSGPEGTGLLACHASGPLGRPRRGPVVIVVHGALRDSDRYLALAGRGVEGRLPGAGAGSSQLVRRPG